MSTNEGDVTRVAADPARVWLTTAAEVAPYTVELEKAASRLVQPGPEGPEAKEDHERSSISVR